ncbi:MAG: prephenate dehydratase [Clostridiales bacterium]|nr:prephenate dehydratase [Clostridiales bacterium]
MKIGYLGPENSYSYLVAQKVKSPEDTIIQFPTFIDVALAVGNLTDKAVLPIENSLEGAVSNTLDILAWECELYITKEICLEINHKLIMKKTGDFNNIKKIITHAQAYGQCRKFLAKRYPSAEIVYTSSTSKAVESIEDDYTAAIAGEHNLNQDLKALPETIQNDTNNITRFVVLEKEPRHHNTNQKISIIFDAENKPGGLLKILQILHEHSLNMTKIESRPFKNRYGNYIFFVDFLGNVNDQNVQSAFDKIKKSTTYFKYLGNY